MRAHIYDFNKITQFWNSSAGYNNDDAFINQCLIYVPLFSKKFLLPKQTHVYITHTHTHTALLRPEKGGMAHGHWKTLKHFHRKVQQELIVSQC